MFFYSSCGFDSAATIYHLNINEDLPEDLYTLQDHTSEIPFEMNDDIRYLEEEATQIVNAIKTNYGNRVTATKLSKLISYFIGRGIRNSLNLGFKILRGERILLKQLVNYIKTLADRRENGQPEQYNLPNFSSFTPKNDYIPKLTRVFPTLLGTLFHDPVDLNMETQSKASFQKAVSLTNEAILNNDNEYPIDFNKNATEAFRDTLGKYVITLLKSAYKGLIADLPEDKRKIELQYIDRLDARRTLIQPEKLEKFVRESVFGMNQRFPIQIKCYCSEKTYGTGPPNDNVDVDHLSTTTTAYLCTSKKLSNLLIIIFRDSNLTLQQYTKNYEEILKMSRSCIWMNNCVKHFELHLSNNGSKNKIQKGTNGVKYYWQTKPVSFCEVNTFSFIKK